MNFAEAMKNELSETKQFTENGAVGYTTTGKKLLDLNFAVSSLRNATEQKIIEKFKDAYYENPKYAIKWLFYARDVREGLGERRLFRIIMNNLAIEHSDIACALIDLIPEYGRWDDAISIISNYEDERFKTVIQHVCSMIKNQWTKDNYSMTHGEPISLMAKWMPSINCSSEDTKKLGHVMCIVLGLSERNYRKNLSALRKYLKVVEVSMSAKEWDKIDYSTVPSRANLIYNGAFLRNDEDRRREYLASLEKGETKINSSVLYPHDIVHKYVNNSDRWWGRNINSKDIALEQMWKALPNLVQEDNSTMCVVDGSGSMGTTVGNTGTTALEVANALGLYFAERCTGAFKDKFITFSFKPQLVDFKNCNSLMEKINEAFRHSECCNTNIEATFDLILSTALQNNCQQSDLPKNILILSDMEFDDATRGYFATPSKTLFQTISYKFKMAGYKMPRLIFWNICSWTGTIPVKQNDLGVALVSGFSVNVVKMIMSGELDPYKCLLEQINAERYDKVEEAIKDLVKCVCYM